MVTCASVGVGLLSSLLCIVMLCAVRPAKKLLISSCVLAPQTTERPLKIATLATGFGFVAFFLYYVSFQQVRLCVLLFQLSRASLQAPGKIKSAVRDAETTSDKVNRFSKDKELLCDGIANHQADVTTMVTDISTLTDQIEELEKYTKYMQVVGKIEDLRWALSVTFQEQSNHRLFAIRQGATYSPKRSTYLFAISFCCSSDIQTALIINSTERSVTKFSELAEITKTLQSSSCNHLVKFANETVVFWYQILKEKLLRWIWQKISLTEEPCFQMRYCMCQLQHDWCTVFFCFFFSRQWIWGSDECISVAIHCQNDKEACEEGSKATKYRGNQGQTGTTLQSFVASSITVSFPSLEEAGHGIKNPSSTLFPLSSRPHCKWIVLSLQNVWCCSLNVSTERGFLLKANPTTRLWWICRDGVLHCFLSTSCCALSRRGSSIISTGKSKQIVWTRWGVASSVTVLGRTAESRRSPSRFSKACMDAGFHADKQFCHPDLQ